MRNELITNLTIMMRDDERLFFLTADMGINLVERIQTEFPKRFINVGIAEQNLIGIASGLVNAGYIPIVYTISNFLIHRCCEQIRNDICLHEYPVVLVGTGTGFDNGPLGPTHHIVDDWGIVKSFPNIEVFCPFSPKNGINTLMRAIKSGKATYIRVSKGDGLNVSEDSDHFITRGNGGDTLVCSYGGVGTYLYNQFSSDTNESLLIFNKLHPVDKAKIANLISPYKKIVVMEDHIEVTGLYSSICNIVAEQGIMTKVEVRAPKHYVCEVVSSPTQMFDDLNIKLDQQA